MGCASRSSTIGRSSFSISLPVRSTASIEKGRTSARESSRTGGAKAHYDSVKAFSETDFSDNLKALTIPVFLIHGDDDQIVPIENSAHKAIKLLQNGSLKVFPGLSRGLFATHPDLINPELLAFAQA